MKVLKVSMQPAVRRVVFVTALSWAATTVIPASVAAAASGSDERFQAAPISRDDGGPEVITGEYAYTSSLVATHFQEPVVALFNVSPFARGDHSDWVPRSSQVLGTLTRPLAPSPTSFRVDVPRQPRGASVDVDNDGEDDLGVRLFAVHLGPNLTGDSYLEQYEQVGDRSIVLDPFTGAIREGTLLVHAPDAEQGFPSSAGADGRFFTDDDPVVSLPAGYTLVTLGGDGHVAFDRSREATMDVLEPPSFGSPDFSDQGLLESFNSLIDLLSVRYAYTELRGLDWGSIRQTFLPRIRAADEAGDTAAYYLALYDLALSVHDGHVFANAGDVELRGLPARKAAEAFGASLGAGGTLLDDGRYLVTYVDPEGPAVEAGWQVGTEIVSVDGLPVREHIDSLPLLEPRGTPETTLLARLPLALAFTDGAETTIEYRQPGGTEVRTAKLMAGDGYRTMPDSGGGSAAEIDFKELEGGYGYVRWWMFQDPLYMIAMWEKFLETFRGAPGLVIDLRANGGGNGELMYTMASYLFPAEEPAGVQWLDYWVYDESAGDLVKQYAFAGPLHSPKPELAYVGAVAVLVREGSASAAEYMPQFLQYHDRAIVVGEHGTDGAGGFVERVSLPGRIEFYFTKGRSYFAGTDELNLEAKGVKLDLRVPITEDNERAKLEGRDPVLEAAVAALGDEAVRRATSRIVGKTWQMTAYVTAAGSSKVVDDPAMFTLTFAADGSLTVQADCNRAFGTYEFGAGGAVAITMGPATLAACPPGSIGEDFLRWLGAASTFQYDGAEFGIFPDPESGAIGLVFRAAEE